MRDKKEYETTTPNGPKIILAKYRRKIPKICHNQHNNEDKIFQSTFWQKPKHTTANIIAKPATNYHTTTKKIYLEKERLRQPIFDTASIWNLDSDSEAELDIRFYDEASDMGSTSDKSALQTVKKRAEKSKIHLPNIILPGKLMITFGDKATTLKNSKKQVARKTLACRAQEPRGTY